MQNLLNEIHYNGPTAFSSERISQEHDLFRSRTALYYTPTENFPPEFVGEGKLEATLPMAFPTIFEWYEALAYQGPKLWVDLLQRATGKLRWIPMIPAKITLIRYDSTLYPHQDLGGSKPLVDAFKYQTTGRRDGRMLYYFGAIRDDNGDDLRTTIIHQELVDHPSKAHTQIIVEPDSADTPGTMQIFGPGRLTSSTQSQ